MNLTGVHFNLRGSQVCWWCGLRILSGERGERGVSYLYHEPLYSQTTHVWNSIKHLFTTSGSRMAWRPLLALMLAVSSQLLAVRWECSVQVNCWQLFPSRMRYMSGRSYEPLSLQVFVSQVDLDISWLDTADWPHWVRAGCQRTLQAVLPAGYMTVYSFHTVLASA